MKPCKKISVKKKLKNITSYAPSKIILLGEHSVVHGCGAIAIPLKAGIYVKMHCKEEGIRLEAKKWNYTCEAGDGSSGGKALLSLVRHLQLEKENLHFEIIPGIPARAGLGASASLAAALVRAMNNMFNLDMTENDIWSAVQKSEKIFHGAPSGIDAAVTVSGKPVWYTIKNGLKKLDVKIPPVFAAYSGEPKDTAHAVAKFKKRLDENEIQGKKRLKSMKKLAEYGLEALISGDLKKLGAAMNENQKELLWFNVSTCKLDRICKIALEAGALGAKLTGGGGGGCAVILTKPHDKSPVIAKLKKNNIEIAGSS